LVDLSVVIPVYGCAETLGPLYERLSAVLDSLTSSYEIVLVDDRSRDRGWEVASGLALADPRVKAIRLSRNFGQHAAITAGLARSAGRFTVVMDCDLQEPPEEIRRLYAQALQGHDVVLTRRARRRQPLVRRITGYLYWSVRKALVGGGLQNSMANLSLLSRKVVNAYLKLGEQNRMYLLIVDWLGFDQITLEVEPDTRHAGKSSYTWGTLLRVAIDGIFFQSTQVLRWIVWVGGLITAAGLGLLVYVVVLLLAGDRLATWTVPSLVTTLVAGIMTMAMGVASLYIGKIFDQVKGRPLYVVDTEIADGAERGEPAEAAGSPAAATDSGS
jgi:glycosyltransferase involved in cell wall biosynthesis